MAEKILSTELYPSIEKTFSDASNIKKYHEIIGAYIDRNVEALTAIGPMKNILFTDRETAPVFKLIGVDPAAVKKAVAKSKYVKANWKMVNNPFNVIMTLIIGYFADKPKQEQSFKLSLSYLGMSMYPSRFSQLFKYGVNENIMNYTINNLSQKYSIKQSGNLMTSITDTVDGAYKLYAKGIRDGNDKDIIQFISAVKTRINALLRKLANEYYKNHSKGNYMNLEVESNDEDNYREANSTMYSISNKTNNIVLKLVVDGPPIKLANTAVNLTKKDNTRGVSLNELRTYITRIVHNDNRQEIYDLIESILLLYLYDDKHKIEDINSQEFLIYCLDIYGRSNTSDKNIIRIKSILDKWLGELGALKKYNSLNTINAYRKTLFIFFVFTIQYYNN